MIWEGSASRSQDFISGSLSKYVSKHVARRDANSLHLVNLLCRFSSNAVFFLRDGTASLAVSHSDFLSKVLRFTIRCIPGRT